MSLLIRPLLDHVARKIGGPPSVTEMVQSPTRNFLKTIRNYKLKGRGKRFFSDLDDGSDDGDDLGLDGSSF